MIMNDVSPCAQEAAVRQAAASGAPPDPALIAHLGACAACRETFEVAGWMTRLAAASDRAAAAHDLPDPSRIWWRARLLQRWEAETRATAPLDFMQRVEVIGALIAAIALVVALWPEMPGFAAGGPAVGGAGWWPALARLFAPSGVTLLVVTGVLLLGLMAVVTVHQFLIED